VSVIDHRGKVKKTYPYEEVMPPYEKLKSLPEAESYLRPGITFEKLDAIANQRGCLATLQKMFIPKLVS